MISIQEYVVADAAAGQIGRITPTAPSSSSRCRTAPGGPHAITPGIDGDLWFTEWGGNRIGRIAVDGRIDEYDLPTARSEPHGITRGPDGALWAALETGALARIAVS